MGFTNYGRAGQFSYARHPQTDRKRALAGSGSNYEIAIGLVLAKDPALTTSDTFIIGKSGSKKPFGLSLGNNFKVNSGIAYPMVTNNTTDLAKKDTQNSVLCLTQGEALCLLDGVIYPDDPVKCAANGHLTKGALADGDLIFGRYVSLMGRDGVHLAEATGAGTGQLGWVSFPW